MLCYFKWQIYVKGSHLQTIYGICSILKVFMEGVSFAMDAATCNCDTRDTAINSGENDADVAGCHQHQQRYSPCRQYQWRDMYQHGSVPPLAPT